MATATIPGSGDSLAAGAANCVLDCAGVRPGQSLFVVSEKGAVEDAVVNAIIATAEAAGARVHVVWSESISKEDADNIPAPVLEAYREADVLISHFPSLKRESLVPHFPAEARVRVPNRARTAAMLASDWARFPYGLQSEIAERLDELMSPGRDWRITSPAGTDIVGTFGEAGGLVGAAFFVEGGDDGRARRNFPGGVHSPRTCAVLDGTIICEYLDNVAMDLSDLPLELELADSSVKKVGGGTERLRRAVEESDGYIDSWHAGVHPRTMVPMSRRDNARQWFSYSHCSPDVLHFHLGRTHETTNVAVFGHTLTVGGQVLYREGRLAVENDPVMAEAVAAAGLGLDMFDNRDVGRW